VLVARAVLEENSVLRVECRYLFSVVMGAVTISVVAPCLGCFLPRLAGFYFDQSSGNVVFVGLNSGGAFKGFGLLGDASYRVALDVDVAAAGE
jgi:hypothetical protein